MTLFALIYIAALTVVLAGLVSTSLALMKMAGGLDLRWRWIIAPLWLPVLVAGLIYKALTGDWFGFSCLTAAITLLSV